MRQWGLAGVLNVFSRPLTAALVPHAAFQAQLRPSGELTVAVKCEGGVRWGQWEQPAFRDRLYADQLAGIWLVRE